MMKHFSLLAGFFLICSMLIDMPSSAQSQLTDQITLYVVRHAEKDTGNNPILSTKGRQRAGDLYWVLQQRPVDLILVSQYRRTGMTGDSVRIYRNIEMLPYKADANGDDLFNLIASLNGKYHHILVIGHSNTVPVIVRRAGASDYLVPELPDSDYDNLFTITAKDGKISWKLEKFGVPSTSKKEEIQMNILQ
ncbi:MAG: histidine phosphatase family protein [Ferruginibacter sp.]